MRKSPPIGTVLGLIGISCLMAFLPALSRAQMGSIKTAMFIVDGFHDEALYLMRDLKRDESLQRVRKELGRRRDDTLAALKTLRWIESPSRQRYDKIYSIVRSYMDAQIATVNSLKESHYARQIERMVRDLKDLREEKLRTLAETKKYETFRTRNPRPVPIIDKSPFESGGPAGEGGEIWFR